MPRRIAEGIVSFCVVLLMFGTATIAEDTLAREGTAANPLTEETFPDAVPHLDIQGPLPPGGAGICPDDHSLLIGDAGPPGWGRLFPHFPMPTRSFSLFRSPASYGWAFRDRCAPTPWTPRGNGIPKRSSCFRMDYRPYQLESSSSTHGPAYYQRFAVFPCPECPTHATHLRWYYGGPK